MNVASNGQSSRRLEDDIIIYMERTKARQTSPPQRIGPFFTRRRSDNDVAVVHITKHNTTIRNLIHLIGLPRIDHPPIYTVATSQKNMFVLTNWHVCA